MNDLFEITCCENKEVLNFDRPKKQKPIIVWSKVVLLLPLIKECLIVSL